MPESLKNILLVMSSGGYLAPPNKVEGQTEQQTKIWNETWARLERFLPELMPELFPQEEVKQEMVEEAEEEPKLEAKPAGEEDEKAAVVPEAVSSDAPAEKQDPEAPAAAA